jgi:outer membrane biosynthesis protein TonB
MLTRLFFFSLLCALVAIAYVISPVELAPAQAYTDQNPTPTPTPAPPPGNGIGLGPGRGSGIGPGIGGNSEVSSDPAKQIYNLRTVDTKSLILSKPTPTYTESARQNCASGTLRLSVVLASSGAVEAIRPISQLPYGLTEEAIKAARHIVFEPALKDGNAVSQYLTLEYKFNMYVDANDPLVKTPAHVLERPEPQYTLLARQHRTQGKVILQLLLGPDAQVQIERIVQGLPDGLTEAAVEASKGIKFTPVVLKEGCAMAQLYLIEYKFKL